MRHALVLAGGGGTRLWPASRRARPKQLLPLGTGDQETLLSATVRRLEPLCGKDRLFVVTAADQAAATWEAVPQVPGQNIIAEPAARNTCAAIGLAAVFVHDQDPDAVIGAIPADQHVADEKGFRAAAERAFAAAERHDAIVTIGIRPTRPETGYGYLELGDALEPGLHRVARFVEKPDQAKARTYLEGGRHLWNAGMFFFRAARLLAEIERHAPEVARVLAQVGWALREGGAPAAAQACAVHYPTVPAVSIDYGVMEKTSGILTVPGDFGWNDVGAWTSLADYRPADAQGNVAQGRLVAHDARGNVTACDDGKLIALVGVSDLVVVQAGNAVLVVPRARAQDVREVVKQLEQQGLEDFV